MMGEKHKDVIELAAEVFLGLDSLVQSTHLIQKRLRTIDMREVAEEWVILRNALHMVYKLQASDAYTALANSRTPQQRLDDMVKYLGKDLENYFGGKGS